MENAEIFINEFHNLPGYTLGEKRCSLFKLLNNLQNSDRKVIDYVARSLTPKSHLDCLFKVELCLILKTPEELLSVLKQGNEEIITKILRSPWFFQQVLEIISVDSVVDEVLPHLSYVSRLRFLKMLARFHKNESEIDELFEAVNLKYGIQVAKLVIIGCSMEKIESVIQEYKVSLPTTELVVIFKRNSSFMDFVLKNSEKSYFCIDDIVARYVASNKTELYMEYSSCFQYNRLGKKITRKLLKQYKNRILTECKSFYSRLHLKTVYNCLGIRDSKLFLLNLCRSVVPRYHDNPIEKFLNYFPKKQQWDIYSEIYESVHKVKLYNNVSHIPDKLVPHIQDVKIRDMVITKKLELARNDFGLIEYFEKNKAINMVKQKYDALKQTRQSYQREGLVVKLIATCKYYNDTEALSEILRYFCKKNFHDGYILIYFLEKLFSIFNPLEFPEGDWEVICNVLNSENVLNLQNSQTAYIYFKHFEYQWKNNNFDKEYLLNVIMKYKNFEDDFNYYEYFLKSLNCFKVDEHFGKVFLEKLIELAAEIYTDFDTLCLTDVCLLNEIIKWNKCHENYQIIIVDNPRLVKSLKAVLTSIETENYISYPKRSYLENIFTHFCIGNKPSDDLSVYINNFYFTRAIQKCWSSQIVLWYLVNDPSTLSKYTENVVTGFSEYLPDFKILFLFKRLSHFDFCSKTIEIYSKSCDETCNHSRTYQTLATLMDPNDFVNLVIKYRPTVERLDDINSDAIRKLYAIQTAVAGSLKYTRSFLALPLLLDFCKGDFLRDALESLYYLFYHSPENKLSEFIKLLSQRAVSVRKHAFFLTSQIAPVDDVFTLLKSASETEKNASIKKHLINTAFRYLNKNPSEKFLDILMLHIPSMFSSADSETLQLLTNITGVSDKYRPKLFMFLINYLISVKDEHAQIVKYLRDLFCFLNTDIMSCLPLSFCTEFIKQHFFVPGDYLRSDDVDLFVLLFMTDCQYDLKEKYEFVFSILTNTNPSSFRDKLDRIKKNSHFISKACIHIKSKSIEQLKVFQEYWMGTFSLDEYFDSYIMLKVTLLFENEFVFANNDFFVQLQSLIRELGSHFFGSIASCIKKNVGMEDFRLMNICFSLYDLDQSDIMCLFLFELLPTEMSVREYYFKKYFNQIKALESHSSPSVQARSNIFVKKININYIRSIFSCDNV